MNYLVKGQNISTVEEIYDFKIGDLYHIYWYAGDEMDFLKHLQTSRL